MSNDMLIAASPGRRFLSCLPDLILCFVFLGVSIFLIDSIFLERLFYNIGAPLYFVILWILSSQATLGQKVFKLYVGNPDGSRITIKKSFIRCFFWCLPAFPLLVSTMSDQSIENERLMREFFIDEMTRAGELGYTPGEPPVLDNGNMESILSVIAIVGTLIMTLPIFFSKDKTTLYDRWSGTRVFRKPPKIKAV